MSEQKIDVLRKRLAKIWKVAPYRIEVQEGKFVVDGKEPTQEQLELCKNDVALSKETARKRMN